jgi:hypothetical protein
MATLMLAGETHHNRFWPLARAAVARVTDTVCLVSALAVWLVLYRWNPDPP